MKNNKYILIFLSSFFEIFCAYIKEYSIEGLKVYGSLGWKDEDTTQSFLWINELDETILIKLHLLCDYLVKNNLINGDKIIIAEDNLKSKLIELGWNTIEAQEYINYLCSIEVKMIDDGEETDSFFVHF